MIKNFKDIDWSLSLQERKKTVQDQDQEAIAVEKVDIIIEGRFKHNKVHLRTRHIHHLHEVQVRAHPLDHHNRHLQ